MIKDWVHLESESQLQEALKASQEHAVVFFKHSTRCSISSMSLNRLARLDVSKFDKVQFYFLDLLAYRNLSNQIAEKLQVYHESPQVLLVRNGDCTYEASHNMISAAELEEQLFTAA